MKFKTHFNSVPVVEHPTGISLCRPSQSMTVREIYERYRNGLPLPAMSNVGYDDDSTEEDYYVMPDFSSMDLADLSVWRRELNAKISEKQSPQTAVAVEDKE